MPQLPNAQHTHCASCIARQFDYSDNDIDTSVHTYKGLLNMQ